MKHAPMLLCLALIAMPQTLSRDLLKLFENDSAQAAHETATATEGRPGVRISNYSFDNPVSGRVPGLLITPEKGSARHPLILFGHWMMEGSPLKNHKEFLDEAVILARAGAICLLLDAPLVRPGVTQDPALLHGQAANAGIQMVREWRRALDLMLARSDVDPQRVAYVGHSFSAAVGAKLTAVEKRIQSFVLMAGVYSLREFVYDDQNPSMVAWRKSVGEPTINAYLEKFPFDDSAQYIAHSAPAAVFVQSGLSDKDIPASIVKKTFAYFQQPKRIEFYNAGHELDSAARRDRVEWLQQRLNLNTVDFSALNSIPSLH